MSARAGVLPLVLALLAPLLVPGRLQAQVAPGVVGSVAGAAGGALLSLSYLSVRAQRGSFVQGYGDVTWVAIPVLAGGAGLGVLGARDEELLRDLLGYGAVGLAAGAALGAGFGSLLGDTAECGWAGALIGAGGGMLAGALIGGLRDRHDGDGGVAGGTSPPPLSVTARFPLPSWIGR